jgi:hypothetical protein
MHTSTISMAATEDRLFFVISGASGVMPCVCPPPPTQALLLDAMLASDVVGDGGDFLLMTHRSLRRFPFPCPQRRQNSRGVDARLPAS